MNNSVELGNVIEISKGKKAEQIFLTKENRSSVIRYLQIDDLRNDSNIKFTNINGGVLVNKKDLIIAWDGANAGTVGYNLEGVIGSTLARLRIKSNSFDSNYLAKFLQSKFKYLRSQCTGATIPHISKSVLTKLKVPSPPLPEQKRIADILDKADSIRQKRKESIALLDEFLKSVFIDMFGDPVRNEKGWEVKKLSYFGDWNSGGTPHRAKKEYYVGNIPWFSSGELNQMYLDESEEKINIKAIKESAAKIIKPNSLLLGMYDTAALKSSITIKNSACNQAIAFSDLCKNKNEILYLYHSIQIGRNYFRSQQRGVRQKNMNLSMIKNLLIPNPPIILQTQFAKIVEQVEATRSKMEESLREMDNQFNALMQRAFNS